MLVKDQIVSLLKSHVPWSDLTKVTVGQLFPSDRRSVQIVFHGEPAAPDNDAIHPGRQMETLLRALHILSLIEWKEGLAESWEVI